MSCAVAGCRLMPGSESVSVARQGDAVVFTGALVRDRIGGLWPQAVAALDGASSLDLAAVPHIDSAGLALLSALSARGGGLALSGSPAGLDELRAAYRLSPSLEFGGGQLPQ